MARRDGTLPTLSWLGLLLSVSFVVYNYWERPQQLFRWGFSLFLLLALFVVARHLWFSVAGPLRRMLGKNKQENGTVHPQPELDRGREQARKKAQSMHNEKAEDFEQRVTEPRREQKLKKLEEKMKMIRGFRGEGAVVGLAGEMVTVDTGASRLVREHNEQIRRRRDEQSKESASHVTSQTDQSDSEYEGEENEEGKMITIALKLPSKSVKKQFRTSYHVKSLYKWLKSLNYSPKLYCLATSLPRQLLLDSNQTLEQCGLTSDTALMLEERDS